MKKGKKKLSIVLLIALFVLFLDQSSKMVIYHHFQTNPGDRIIEVLPFFNIVLVWNYGISFGVFNNAAQNQILFILTSIAIIAVLLWWYRKPKNNVSNYPIAFIVGGALGNIMDRFQYGAVLDFLDFHFAGYHYPAFNIADSFIVIGVLILMFAKTEKSSKKARK